MKSLVWEENATIATRGYMVALDKVDLGESSHDNGSFKTIDASCLVERPTLKDFLLNKKTPEPTLNTINSIGSPIA